MSQKDVDTVTESVKRIAQKDAPGIIISIEKEEVKTGKMKGKEKMEGIVYCHGLTTAERIEILLSATHLTPKEIVGYMLMKGLN